MEPECDRKIALKPWTAPCPVKACGAVVHLEADVAHTTTITDCLMIVLFFLPSVFFAKSCHDVFACWS